MAERLLLLATEAASGRGGIAQYVKDLAEGIAVQDGCDELVCLLRGVAAFDAASPPKLRVAVAGAGRKLRYVAASTRRLLGDGRYDAVLCSHVNLAPLAWLAARRARCPFGVVLHGIEAWQRHASPLVRAALARAAGFVAVSEVTWMRFRSWSPGGDRIFYLPGTVDTVRFSPGPRDAALAQRLGIGGRKVLLTMARLDGRERYKGFDEVLGVLADVARAEPDVIYLVAGDGDDRARLTRRADELGLAARVRFLGAVAEADKVALYRSADAFAMPGRGEGLGIVYLEAMACGIPVVASALDGSREAVAGGEAGIVVDPDDPADLRDGLVAALRRPRGRPPALARFERARFRERCADLIRWLRGDAAPSRARGNGAPGT